MVCKHCEKETLTEGAVYCAHCGKRLDGKIQCENCGKFNESENAFCVFCGTRIDGKTVCTQCGELIEAAFCPHCGTAANASQKEKKETAKKANPDKQKLWNKIFGLTTGGVALAGALFALIFVFLIGFVPKIVGSANSVTVFGSTESITIYHFFGDAYKELVEVETNASEMLCGEMWIADYYVYTIVCTVLAALTLCCVVAFFIPAVISYVKYATGKTEKVDSKWSLLTILSFLGGLGMLFAQNYINATIEGSGTVATISTKPNGATIAGMVLCIVFATLWFIGYMVSYGKEWSNKAFVKKAVCITLSVIFAVVLCAVWQHLSLGIKMENSDASIETNFGPALYNAYLLPMVEGFLGEEWIYAYEGQIIAFYVCNIFMVFVSVVGVVCIFASLKANASAAKGKKHFGTVFAALAAFAAVCALALTIVAHANLNIIFEEQLANTFNVTYNYATCIVVLVLSGVNLAATITHTAFEKKKTE